MRNAAHNPDIRKTAHNPDVRNPARTPPVVTPRCPPHGRNTAPLPAGRRGELRSPAGLRVLRTGNFELNADEISRRNATTENIFYIWALRSPAGGSQWNLTQA